MRVTGVGVEEPPRTQEEEEAAQGPGVFSSLLALGGEALSRVPRRTAEAMGEVRRRREEGQVEFPLIPGLLSGFLRPGSLVPEPVFTPVTVGLGALTAVVDEPAASALAAALDYVGSNLMAWAAEGYRDAPPEEKARIVQAVTEYQAALANVEPGTEEYRQIQDRVVRALESEGLTLEEVARRLRPEAGGMIYPTLLLYPERREEFERLVSEGVPVEEAERQLESLPVEVGFEFLAGLLTGILFKRLMARFGSQAAIEVAEAAARQAPEVAEELSRRAPDVAEEATRRALPAGEEAPVLARWQDLVPARTEEPPPGRPIPLPGERPQRTIPLPEERAAITPRTPGELAPGPEVVEGKVAFDEVTGTYRPLPREPRRLPSGAVVRRSETPPTEGAPLPPGARRPLPEAEGRPPLPEPGARPLPETRGPRALPPGESPAEAVRAPGPGVYRLPERELTLPHRVVMDNARSAIVQRYGDPQLADEALAAAYVRAREAGLDVDKARWTPDEIRQFAEILSQEVFIEPRSLMATPFRDPRSPVWDRLAEFTSRISRVSRQAEEGRLDPRTLENLRRDLADYVNEVYRLSGGQYRVAVKVDSNGMPTRIRIVNAETGRPIAMPKRPLPPKPKSYSALDELLEAVGIYAPEESPLRQVLQNQFETGRLDPSRLKSDMFKYQGALDGFIEDVEQRLGRRLTDDERDAVEELAALWGARQRGGRMLATAPERMDPANVAAMLEAGYTPATADEAVEVAAGYRILPGSEKYRTDEELLEDLKRLRRRAARKLRQGDDSLARAYNEALERYKDHPALERSRLRPIALEAEEEVARAAEFVEDAERAVKAVEQAEDGVSTATKTELQADEVLDDLRDRAAQALEEEGDIETAEAYNALRRRYAATEEGAERAPPPIEAARVREELSDDVQEEVERFLAVLEGREPPRARSRGRGRTTLRRDAMGNIVDTRTGKVIGRRDPLGVYRDLDTGEPVNPIIPGRPAQVQAASTWETLPEWAKQLPWDDHRQLAREFVSGDWPAWVGREGISQIRKPPSLASEKFSDLWRAFGDQKPAPGSFIAVRTTSPNRLKDPLRANGLVLRVKPYYGKNRPPALKVWLTTLDEEGNTVIRETVLHPNSRFKVHGNVTKESWEQILKRALGDDSEFGVPSEFLERVQKAEERVQQYYRGVLETLRSAGVPYDQELEVLAGLRRVEEPVEEVASSRQVEEVVQAVTGGEGEVASRRALQEALSSGDEQAAVSRHAALTSDLEAALRIPFEASKGAPYRVRGLRTDADDVFESLIRTAVDRDGNLFRITDEGGSQVTLEEHLLRPIKQWLKSAGNYTFDDEIPDILRDYDGALEEFVSDVTSFLFTEESLTEDVVRQANEVLQLPRLAAAADNILLRIGVDPDSDVGKVLQFLTDAHRRVWSETVAVAKEGEFDLAMTAARDYARAIVQARRGLLAHFLDSDTSFAPRVLEYVHWDEGQVIRAVDGQVLDASVLADEYAEVLAKQEGLDTVTFGDAFLREYSRDLPTPEQPTAAYRELVGLTEAARVDLGEELARFSAFLREFGERLPVPSAVRRALSEAFDSDQIAEGTRRILEVSKRLARYLPDERGEATVDAAAAMLLPVRPLKPIVRYGLWTYARTATIRGAVPLLAAGVLYTTPVGRALVGRDDQGRLVGYLPSYWRATTARIADTLGIGTGSFEYDQLLNAAIMLFDAVDQTTNMTVGGAYYAWRAWSGEDTWVGDMLTREDLTPHEKWALITALRVGLSGEDAVRGAYEELARLNPDSTTSDEVEEILSRHRNAILDLVGTMLFDPTDLINLGTVWKGGTGAVNVLNYLRTGEKPVKWTLDMQEWRMWRAARAFYEEGNGKALWNILTEKLENVIYTPEVRAMAAARKFDMAISSRLFGTKIDKQNWRKVVELAFSQKFPLPAPPEVRRLFEEAGVNDKAFKAVVKYVSGKISELPSAKVTDDMVDKFVREGISRVSRDLARYVYGAADSRPGALLGPILRFSKWQKTALGRLLLNAFNVGFHITNQVGDYGMQVQTIGRYMFAPEAEGTLSLVSTGAMRRFWQERLGHIPAVVMEAFSVLGEEETLRLFGRTPVLRNVPVLNRIPQPEALSALRVYTATFIHWMGPLHKNALTPVVDVVRGLGLDDRHAAIIYGRLAGIWRNDEAAVFIRQYLDDLVDQGVLEEKNVEKAYQAIFAVYHRALARSAAAALAAADEARGLTIHHYWRKTVLDQVVEVIFPYHFWFTRGMLRWTEWIVNNPTLLSNQIRIEQAISKALNGDPSDPEYLRRYLPLPTSAEPWLEEAIEAAAELAGYDVDASGVTRAMDTLVLTFLPTGGEFDVTEDKVYVNVLDKFNPLRNVYAMFGGETYEPDVPEDTVDSAVEKLITAGGRFPAAYSPLVPLLASGLNRVFGVDTTAVRYMMEPSVPFAQDRVIRGITSDPRVQDLAERFGVDLPEEGISLDPLWRRAVDLGSGIWTQDAPDYYYKMAARLIAIDVQRGVLRPDEAARLIMEQDTADPDYAHYFNQAVRYYAGRGAVSGITSILARYQWDGDIRRDVSELYELAVVRDANGDPVIGPDGNPVYDFDRPEVQAYLKEKPWVDIFRTSFGEFEERQARAAMEFYYSYASAYTRRQFRLFNEARTAETLDALTQGDADRVDWDLVRDLMAGRAPLELIEKASRGEATDAERVALVRAFTRFYDEFTNPDLEARRIAIESQVDSKVRRRYPDYPEWVEKYYRLRDEGRYEEARQFLQESGLGDAFDYRARLLENTGKFPTTEWEVAVNPPSERQLEYAVSIGIPEEEASRMTSYQLAAEIDRRRTEALEYVRKRYGSRVTMDYIEALEDTPRPLLTEEEQDLLDEFRRVLYVGPGGEVSDDTWRYALSLGLSREEARRMSANQVRRFIERRKEEAARQAISETGADLTIREVHELAELASERGLRVLKPVEKRVVQAYWDALYVGERPVTKDLVKLAAELGADKDWLRTASGREIQEFIDQAMARKQAEADARRAKFAAAAAAAGLSVDEMNRLLDVKDRLKKRYGNRYWNYLTDQQAQTLRQFYRAYYGPSARDLAWEKALEKTGMTDSQIRDLIRRREMGQWLPEYEYRKYREFFDYYNIYRGVLESRERVDMP